MPERKKGEPLNKFIGRFMKSKRERRDFPEEKRRAAVAYSEAERHKRK